MTEPPEEHKSKTTQSTWDISSTTPFSSPSSSTNLFGSHDFNPGDTIAGRYRIVAILGKGGMGEVYRADDLTLGTSVALKFLPPEFAADPQRLEKFRSEVRLARQVSHPNICRVYDIVEAQHDERTRLFITMEYIDGEDLASLVRRIGRLPGDKATQIARQLCAGLAAAHEQGIIHRDLKPANVMIDGRGRARITDFGIASAEAVEGHAAVAGTPQYMAPEQLDGREATKASDIFSLGLVLYELFAGKKVFDARTVAEIRSLHKTSATSTSLSSLVPDINPAVERVIDRCLARDPRDRPASAIAVAAALPGGDPVAAALAAGETPSPEMLAAVGHNEGTNPWTILACIASTVAIAVATALLVPLAKLEPRVSLPRSSDVLVDNAQQIIRALGHDPQQQSTAHGWFENTNYLEWIAANDDTPGRWDRLSESNQPPPIIFWYRQHTGPMRPANARFDVRTFDPPLTQEGMILLMTGPEGRLHRFFAVPPEQPARQTDDEPRDEPDFQRIFEFAGLDLAKFTPTDFAHDPRFALDKNLAWEGAFPDAPDIPIVVHAGIADGRLASFDILEPWNINDPDTAPAGQQMGAQVIAVMAIICIVILGGAVLAWRNVRLGRIDRRGAIRASLFAFVCLTISNIISARQLPFFLDIVFGENLLIGEPLRQAAFFALFYLAIEPYARRVWPSMLVTWARVTTGKLRDPLVGRDIIVGILTGAVFALIATCAGSLNHVLDIPAPTPRYTGTFETRDAIAGVFGSLGGSIVGATAWTLILVLLRLLLRKKTLAAVGFILVGIAFGLGPNTEFGLGLVFIALLSLVRLVLLLRFGLFALYVAFLTASLLEPLSTDTDLSVWYAPPTYVVIAFLALLAAYGYHTATAGRPLVPEPQHNNR